MSEKIETKLIDSVPGMDPAAAPKPPSREVVHIAAEDFKGDPSRVIGHPSNPNNAMIQAYVDYLIDLEAQRNRQNQESN